MSESEPSKSEGNLTKIIVGVATSVLTAVVLAYLGLGGGHEKKVSDKSVPPQVQNVQPSADTDIRAKQAELEQRIKELSESKQTEIQQGIAGIKAKQAQAQETAPQPEEVDIRGTWYAPSTGSAYTVQQNGNLVTLQEYTAQVLTAYAQGYLRGRRADFEFYSTTLGIRGNGFLEISPDGSGIAMTVINPINGMRVTSDLQRTE